MKDYFKILGVDENASKEDLKKAYRELAMRYHPDRNKEADAETKFKDITEAYDVLNDDTKRAQWEQQRNGGGFESGGFNFHFRGGASPFGDIFEQIFRGQGFDPFSQRQPTRNADTHIQLNITLEEAYAGKTVPIQFTDNSGKNVNLVVTVPAGVENGLRLRYAGNGTRVQPNLPPGDLYITIFVTPHDKFERNGPHLFGEIPVSVWEALLGCEKNISTIDGTAVSLKIPSLSADQTILRIKNKGMPVSHNSKQRGDLMMRVKHVMPTSLTPEQTAQLKTWIQT